MPQALTGFRKSIPKLVRVNADDSRALLYRNLGNGRRLPLFWATTVTLVSGTNPTLVASGIEFHGFKICDGLVEITPIVSGTSSAEYSDTNILGKVYVVKDTTLNQILIKSTVEVKEGKSCDFDVYIYFGSKVDFSSTDANQIWKRY